MSSKPNVYFVYVVLIFVQVLFGLNFVASKIIVTNFAPVHWAWIRFFVAGTILLVFSSLRKNRISLSLSFIGKAAFFGFLGFTIGQLAFLKGIKLTTTVNTSIICSMIPVFTLVVVILRGIEKLTKLKLVGLVISLVGVLTLRGLENFTLSDKTLIGDLLILICSISTALYIAYSKKFLTSNDHFGVSTWMFLMASLQLFLFSLIEQTDFIVPVMSKPLVISMLFAVLGATFLTYFLSNWALVHVDSSKVSIFIYLQPVVAGIFAWAYLGEVVTLKTLVSSCLILIGFAITLYDGHLQKRK